ncbi:YkvA family protein [Dethiothermospora halolimnae]|uniref:YkvA family protein n=1 Tax=Dethiothermospora halolimnae TaxID=3114390 RepID=UPI003CCC00B5
MNIKDKEAIKQVIKRLKNYSKLIYDMYKAPYITKKQKALLSTAIGYLISPIELVPGFIPVAGQVDDLLVVLTILKKVLKGIDPNIREELLKKHGITMIEIEEDIKICNKVAKVMLIKTGKFLGKAMLKTGKIGYKIGKKVTKKGYKVMKNKYNKKKLK